MSALAFCGIKCYNSRGQVIDGMGLARCVVYMAIWGLACFPLGRLFKGMHLRWDRFPFAAYGWERGGAIYERTGIRLWKDIAPDVSKLFPGIVPKKTLTGGADVKTLRDMLEETCVAELTHALLCLTGLALPLLWPGPGGWWLYAAYALLGNISFIMIQRYNRPRFQRLLAAMERRERRFANAGSDTVQQ